MKQLFIFIATISLYISCNKTPEANDDTQECVTCAGGVVTRTYGPDSSITIHNVLTVVESEICDSMLYDPFVNSMVWPTAYPNISACSEDEYFLAKENGDTGCLCYSPDKVYWDKINDYLYIDGIKKFPYNLLMITYLKDTLFKRIFLNYDNESNNFVGNFVTDTYNMDVPYRVFVGEGDVRYDLLLFEDKEQKKLIDVITGYITLIKTPQECVPTNCFPREENDPMLIPGGYN